MKIVGRTMFYQFRLYQAIQNQILDGISGIADDLIKTITITVNLCIIVSILFIILGVRFIEE